MSDIGHWTTDLEIPENATGFVYLIYNRTKNIGYIGQKGLFKKVVRKPLKGKKRKRRCVVDSDWKTYKSSSNLLKGDIKTGDVVEYHILCWCSSKSELNYTETKYQFDVNVISSENWYNGMLNIRQGKTNFSENWLDNYNRGLTYMKSVINC